MELTTHPIIEASKSTDLKKFMEIMFPENWYPIISRIIESGAQFDKGMCKWYPRGSNVPFTIKTGKTDLEAAIKSCMYRIHDCFHQLWGLPTPTNSYTTEEYYLFKRAQMCGEVAVLTMSEFILSQHLYNRYPEIQSFLYKRCAIPMMEGPLKYKTPLEIAARLDGILHKKLQPKWVREHKESKLFSDYYIPMLEQDRVNIDNNWNVMKKVNWLPTATPNSRYSTDLDGLELTIWMINDFYHLIDTDIKIDEDLASFNKERRSKLVLPIDWI